MSLPLENHVSTYTCIVFGENWNDRSNYTINVAAKKLIQFRKKNVHKQSFQIVYVVEKGYKILREIPSHINISTGACPTADSPETEHKNAEQDFTWASH